MAKKILVIDDELDVLQMVVFILKKNGFAVISATGGQEAIDLAYKEKPDLIILDLWLPDMDGAEVSRRLKADDNLRNIPIILFTASAEMIEDRVKECNANDYLLKPFEYQELLDKVAKRLNR
jgi:DNA-binding response OmpR family regulator